MFLKYWHFRVKKGPEVLKHFILDFWLLERFDKIKESLVDYYKE